MATKPHSKATTSLDIQADLNSPDSLAKRTIFAALYTLLKIQAELFELAHYYMLCNYWWGLLEGAHHEKKQALVEDGKAFFEPETKNVGKRKNELDDLLRRLEKLYAALTKEYVNYQALLQQLFNLQAQNDEASQAVMPEFRQAILNSQSEMADLLNNIATVLADPVNKIAEHSNTHQQFSEAQQVAKDAGISVDAVLRTTADNLRVMAKHESIALSMPVFVEHLNTASIANLSNKTASARPVFGIGLDEDYDIQVDPDFSTVSFERKIHQLFHSYQRNQDELLHHILSHSAEKHIPNHSPHHNLLLAALFPQLQNIFAMMFANKRSHLERLAKEMAFMQIPQYELTLAISESVEAMHGLRKEAKFVMAALDDLSSTQPSIMKQMHDLLQQTESMSYRK